MGIDSTKSPIRELGEKIDALQRIPIKTSIIFAISLASFFAYYDITNYSYISPVLKTQWNVGDTEIANGASMTILGYVIGAFCITLFADSYGRKPAFILSISILGLGSLLAASSQNMTQMSIFRLLVGVGIGSEIALASVYVGEMSPKLKRGKYTSIIIVLGWIGVAASGPISFLLIQQGQIMNMEGWRIVIGIAVIASIASLIFRLRMPESPRWLLSKGKVEETNLVLSTLGIAPLEVKEFHPKKETRLRALGNKSILSRILFLTGVWFLVFIPIYASLLLVVEYVNQGFSISESISINMFSSIGFVAGGILSVPIVERLERKYQIAIASSIMSIAFILRGLLINDYFGLIASGFIAFAANAWLITSLLVYTTESFPTKIRTSASGMVEGSSRAIASIGPFIFLLLQPFGFLNVMIGISLFSFAAAAITLAGGKPTRGKSLEKLNQE